MRPYPLLIPRMKLCLIRSMMPQKAFLWGRNEFLMRRILHSILVILRKTSLGFKELTGVGKTFVAKRLAFALLGEMDAAGT